MALLSRREQMFLVMMLGLGVLLPAAVRLAGSGRSAPAGDPVPALLDPDEASFQELSGLPGMTPAVAARIVASRRWLPLEASRDLELLGYPVDRAPRRLRFRRSGARRPRPGPAASSPGRRR